MSTPILDIIKSFPQEGRWGSGGHGMDLKEVKELFPNFIDEGFYIKEGKTYLIYRQLTPEQNKVSQKRCEFQVITWDKILDAPKLYCMLENNIHALCYEVTWYKKETNHITILDDWYIVIRDGELSNYASVAVGSFLRSTKLPKYMCVEDFWRNERGDYFIRTSDTTYKLGDLSLYYCRYLVNNNLCLRDIFPLRVD